MIPRNHIKKKPSVVVHAYNPSTGDSWDSLVRQPRLLDEFQTTERSVTSSKTGI